MEQLNALSANAAREEFLRACGSEDFATKLAAARPFSSAQALHDAAARVWWTEARSRPCDSVALACDSASSQVPVSGWLQAFAAHPRLGDVEGLRAKFAATAAWCEGEQRAVASASEETLAELAAWNARFESKFGHIFILCATGVAADAVLAAVRARYPASPHAELAAAAGEQAKITALRLDKLLATLGGGGAPAAAERRTSALAEQVTGGGGGAAKRPPITTHILDTARGVPARGVSCLLEHRSEAAGGWRTLGRGETDGDGRCGTLLASGHPLVAGEYRMSFGTGGYLGSDAFYPSVSVDFAVAASQCGQHFHIPLLLSPFGYSTYRGS